MTESAGDERKRPLQLVSSRSRRQLRTFLTWMYALTSLLGLGIISDAFWSESIWCVRRGRMRQHRPLLPTSAQIRLVWTIFSGATYLHRRLHRLSLCPPAQAIYSALRHQRRQLLLTTSPHSATLHQHQCRHQPTMISRISGPLQDQRQRRHPR